jgi:hypothetical protein
MRFSTATAAAACPRSRAPTAHASGGPKAGGTATAVNTATAEGTWTSANPNFPNPKTVSGGPATHALTAKTTALQKAVADLTHPGSPRAGDTLEYTLNFQVSDYFALSDFNLADVLTDGQAFDTTFTPTITYTQKAQTLTGTFLPANFSAVVQANGTTTIDFDVSTQVDSLGLVTDGPRPSHLPSAHLDDIPAIAAMMRALATPLADVLARLNGEV